MTEPRPYRHHGVGCLLSDEEYQALCAVREALGLTVHDLLVMAIRRARRILAEERRRQHRNGNH